MQLSGLTAVGYELVWIRRFTQFFGSTAQVFSVILIAVILGIGLGSLAYQRLRQSRKLSSRHYGWLEIGIAVSAPLSYHVSSGALTRALKALPIEQGATAWVIAFAAVFLLTAVTSSLIGASLPWLHDLIASARENKRAPDAYSAYNLGAAYGAAVVGIGALLWLGYSKTCWALATINGIAGLYFLFGREVSLPLQKRATQKKWPAKTLGFAFLIGFATLFIEAWVGQVADYLLGGTRIGIASTLATYFIGISVGARLPLRGAAVERLRATLAVQAMALAALSVVLLFPTEGPADSKSLAAIVLSLYWIFSVAGGAQFPALVDWMSGSRDQRIAFTAAFYVETFGGAAGAAVFAFLAFPWLHTPGCLVFASGLYLLTLAVLAKGDKWRAAIVTAAIGCVLLSPGHFTPARSWLAAAVASLSPGDTVTHQTEDTSGWLMVVDKADGTRELRLGPYLSGATDVTRRNTQVIQGILAGSLLKPGSRALQIGYGTGEISRSLLAASGTDLTIVELHPKMIDLASEFFGPVQKEGHPIRRLRQDGVAYVRATNETYDLVLSDSFILHSEMSARLYTRDHFEAVKARLRPGGLALVWIPTEAGHSSTVSLLRTLLGTFPHVQLYAPTPELGREIFAVCYTEDIDLLARHREGLDRIDKKLGDDKTFPLDTSYLWTRWVASRNEIQRFVDANPGIESHEEDRPVLEWYVSVKKDLVEGGRGTAREIVALRDVKSLLSGMGASRPTAQRWEATLARFEPLEQALRRYVSGRDPRAIQSVLSQYPKTNVARLIGAIERALASQPVSSPSWHRNP